jgi:membrane-bound lytic murein transglycosylase MltF
MCLKLFLFSLLLMSSAIADDATKLAGHIKHKRFGGLKRVIKERYIRILTTKNSFDYYIYQGKARGIQYEMAREFTKFLNRRWIKKGDLKIQFELIPVDHDKLIPQLLAGKADIIATGMSITPARKKQVTFATPYRKVDEVIVTRAENILQDYHGKKFSVRKSSSYYEAIKNYNKKVKPEEFLKVEVVDENLQTGDIIELISLGKYDYTLADSYLAEMALNTFGGLAVHENHSFGKDVGLAWAVKKEDSKLLRELNKFMPKIRKGTLLGNVFDKKYFNDFNRIRSAEFDFKTSHISRYDQLIKKYAKKYGFDWRLLAALAYQESHFNADIVNKWGAIGLFQVKQMTANEPYVNIKNITGKDNVENNIHAGIKYLHWIKKTYFDPVEGMSEKAKLRMTMAAYNAGPGRVLQAIKLARKMKLNPLKWFRNVELAMLRLHKTEPVTYVSEINKRYVAFLLLKIDD